MDNKKLVDNIKDIDINVDYLINEMEPLHWYNSSNSGSSSTYGTSTTINTSDVPNYYGYPFNWQKDYFVDYGYDYEKESIQRKLRNKEKELEEIRKLNDKLTKKLLWLMDNPEKLEEFPALKEAYDHYLMLRKLILGE